MRHIKNKLHASGARNALVKICVAQLLTLQALALHAQTPRETELKQRNQFEQLRQEQLQEQALRSNTNTATTINNNTSSSPSLGTGSDTCFKINRIIWGNSQQAMQPPLYLKRLAYNARYLNHELACLSLNDLNNLQKQLSNALIEHGHITSKIAIPSQNISSGVLRIDWFPGLIEEITFDPAGGAPIGSLSMLFPLRQGKLYNQREFDQSLENLKRMASQSGATLELQPGQNTGTSKIVYKLEETPFKKRINGTIGIDNAGSESTGVYQANGSLSIDSPLHLNDILTFTLNHNADANNNQHNTSTSGVNWDFVSGYGTFGLGYTNSRYKQTLLGDLSNLSYEGKSQDLYASLGYMLYRNSNSKTSISFKFGRKTSHNFIEETEIPIQMRDYVYSDTTLSHVHYHKNQQYSIALNLRQNFPKASKAVGFIYGEPDWDGGWRTYGLSASANIPFKLKQSNWKYSGTLRAQYANKPTPNSEFFSVAGRYSVRGFDESFSLSGEDGLYTRNELSYLYGANQSQQVYLGLDWGKIKSATTSALSTTSIAGSVLGLRGSYRGFNYDFALGRALKHPKFYQQKTTIYATLSRQF